MHPKLNKNSYIKIKPDRFIASFIVKEDRINVDINETAFKILSLCNGYYSLDSIVKKISEIYSISEETARDNVTEFLNPLIELGAISNCLEKENINIVKGSTDIFYPDHIIWELTTDCPLRCQHCYHPTKDHSYITRDNIDFILDLIKTTGVYGVQLTGGEPMLHPDIAYIVKRLSEMNVQISISTSGFILNDQVKNVIKSLKTHGLIRVSLDGTEKYHNQIRRNDNSYNNCIGFIKYAINEHIMVQVATVLIDQPLSMIQEHVENLRSLGVSSITMSPVSLQGEATKIRSLPLYNMKSVESLILKLNQQYATNSFFIQQPRQIKQRNCGCGHKIIRIKPNLYITPCPMIDIIMGNLSTHQYDSILRYTARNFHDLISPGEICGECPKKDECKTCSAYALQIKSNIAKCTWYESQKTLLGES